MVVVVIFGDSVCCSMGMLEQLQMAPRKPARVDVHRLRSDEPAPFLDCDNVRSSKAGIQHLGTCVVCSCRMPIKKLCQIDLFTRKARRECSPHGGIGVAVRPGKEAVLVCLMCGQALSGQLKRLPITCKSLRQPPHDLEDKSLAKVRICDADIINEPEKLGPRKGK